MKSNLHKRWGLMKNAKSNFIEFIIKAPEDVKKILYLMVIAIALTACAAFAGRETAGEYIDDASITASVKSQILQDPHLKMFQIHVETFKNQVQLSGFVDSSQEVATAGSIARSVEGVQDVKNNLVIRNKGRFKRSKRK